MSANDAFNPAPVRGNPWTSEIVRWAQRMSRAPYKNFIRELAGQRDDALDQLEAQARLHPRLRMPRGWRITVGLTVVMTLVGATLLAAGLEAKRLPELAALEEQLQWGGIGLLVACLASAIVCALMHVHHGPTLRAYPELVLHVARLDEQHPWLYETLETVRHGDAEAYRQKTLAIRGPLRGVDLPMMRLVIAAHAEVLRSRTANEVVHALQSGVAAGKSGGPELGAQAAPPVLSLDETVGEGADGQDAEDDDVAMLLRFPSAEDSMPAPSPAAANA